jgi:hypothetical protein
MKISIKWLVALGFVLLAASVLLRTYAQIHNDPDPDEDQEEAITIPSRVSVINGQTVITVHPPTQKQMGIAVAPLRPVYMRREESAAATVLATEGLVMLRNSYIAAEAQLETAQAQLGVSQREYERLATLYNENQNTSQKALQAAQGIMQTDRAKLDAAQKGIEIASSAVRQSWGGAVASWVVHNSPELASVLSQKATLIQVSLPPGTPFEKPREIRLSTPNGSAASADYVSPFPQVDSRIQGISELYFGHAYPILEPGMYLTAHLPVGKRLRGVLIPPSAVVWWQGTAWVYEQASPIHFTRCAVPQDQPLGNGYFASSGFAPGTRVVTQGAQVLLSEEFRSQIQPED